MSYLKTFNSFYIFYEKNTITSVQNNIKFYARFNDDFLLEEELIITLCLQWNNQFEVNEIVKKLMIFLIAVIRNYTTRKWKVLLTFKKKQQKSLKILSKRKKHTYQLTSQVNF